MTAHASSLVPALLFLEGYCGLSGVAPVFIAFVRLFTRGCGTAGGHLWLSTACAGVVGLAPLPEGGARLDRRIRTRGA